MKDLVTGSKYENCAWAVYIVPKKHISIWSHASRMRVIESYRDVLDYYTADVKARGEGAGPKYGTLNCTATAAT